MMFESQAIHAGQESAHVTRAVMTPIYQTSTYKQDGVGQHSGYVYSRTGNPTRSFLLNGRRRVWVYFYPRGVGLNFRQFGQKVYGVGSRNMGLLGSVNIY